MVNSFKYFISLTVLSTMAGCSAAPGVADQADDGGEPVATTHEALGAPGWSGWSDASGGLVSTPSIIAATPSMYEVTATGPDGTIWTEIYTGAWSGWWSLGNNGNKLSYPPASIVTGGEIYVFVQDVAAGTMLFKMAPVPAQGSRPVFSSTWTTLKLPNSLSISNWGTLAPNVVGGPMANQINLFVTANDGTVWVTKGFTGAFGYWQSLGTTQMAYQPAAVSWGTNRLDVFAAGYSNHQLNHRYSNDSGTTWYPSTGWETLGGSIYTTPSVVSWGSNRLDIFAATGNTASATIGHLAWNGSSWGTWCGTGPCWDSLGAPLFFDGSLSAQQVAVAPGSGTIDVLFQGPDHGLDQVTLTALDTATSSAKWSAPVELTSCFAFDGVPAVTAPWPGLTNDLLLAVKAYNASGNAEIWANTSIQYFPFQGTSQLPTCACGAIGETCCNDAVCNSSNAVCSTGYPPGALTWSQECMACGQANELACAGNVCAAGTQSVNGLCQACGADGIIKCNAPQAACQGTDLPNAQGICSPCGTDGVGVCPNGKCTGDNNPNIDWVHEATTLLCSGTCGHSYQEACMTHPNGASGTPTWEFRCVDGNKFPAGGGSGPGGCTCYPSTFSGTYDNDGEYYCDSGPLTGLCLASAKYSTLPQSCN